MTKNIKLEYNKLVSGPYGFVTDVAVFIVITYGFHLLFRFYAREIMSIPVISDTALWLADVVYSVSLWFNQHVLGMQIVTEPVNTMWFVNNYGVTVNSSCSGLKQFFQVLVLFLIFPGPWKHKAWFIPMGILIMFITNVFRIVVLSLVQSWKPEYFDFCHTWILRPFFYVVLFALWVWWVEKFRRKPVAV
jgi:exosortase/archaeosortase family protein